MSKLIPGGLAAVCVVLAAMCVGLFQQRAQLASRIDALEAKLDAAEDAEKTVDSVSLELAALTDERDELAAKLAESTDAQGEMNSAQKDASLTESMAIAQTQIDASDEDDSDSKNPFAKMFEQMGSDEMIDMSSSMQVNMQYAGLFTDLDLPADVQEEVRAILTEGVREQLAQAMSAMKSGDMDSIAGMKQGGENLSEETRRKLAAVLNDEELALYDDYEANKQQRVLEQSYGTQLGMMAPGLSEEDRALAGTVLAEEMVIAQEDAAVAMLEDSERRNGMAAVFENQDLAMERALERLAYELDEDQLAAVERFIEQQRAMTEASMQMMEGMFSGGDETGETPQAPEPVAQ
jgi:hypothetical protein